MDSTMSRVKSRLWGATVLLLPILWLVVAGCSRSSAPSDDGDELPEALADWELFEGELHRLQPARDVVGYEVNSVSFYDYADCNFVLKLPRAGTIAYLPAGVLEFPVGTVLAQTLSYADADLPGGRQLVETRVLARRADKWLGLTYLWNREQTAARLELLGARVPIRRRLPDGSIREQSHIVPNFNDCKRCHRIDDRVQPIAIGVQQLNHRSTSGTGEDQLTAWQRLGRLRGLPATESLARLARWNDPASGTVEQRARAWLEANCAHCHNSGGAARHSGLHLAAAVSEPSVYGVLKSPIAAGRGSGGLPFDIVPGQPQLSILLHRVRATEAGVVMPEYGRTQVHEEGVALLSEWIASMPSAADAFRGLVGMVSDLPPEVIAHWAEEALSQGNSRRGAVVYNRDELNCKKCHAISGHGANVGPDLAKIGPQTKAEQIVESVLLPDKVVKEGFRAVTVQTQDGVVLTGIQVADKGFEIVLRDPVRGDTAITKSTIAERAEGASLMPMNLVAALPRQDFLDLVRYLMDLNLSPAAPSSQPPASGP